MAQNYPAPQEGSWVVRDFKFHTGQVLPELKLSDPVVEQKVTMRHLLTHTSGLPSFRPYDRQTQRADSIARLLFSTRLVSTGDDKPVESAGDAARISEDFREPGLTGGLIGSAEPFAKWSRASVGCSSVEARVPRTSTRWS